MEFSINNFFEKEECDSIIEFTDSIGIPFSYSPTETWDCKRIHNENFKKNIVDKLLLNYKNNQFKLWFDLNEFDIKDVVISLTKYYNGRWLDLHLDKTSHFTTVILLSDGFDDGRFALSNSPKKINDAQKYHLNIGESISFDGTKIYHGVMPVTTGVRCALNIWMTETQFDYSKYKSNKTII
jgi:hypothetical protein